MLLNISITDYLGTCPVERHPRLLGGMHTLADHEDFTELSRCG